MSTDTSLEITSSNSENTLQIAEIIGHNLIGGEVIELVSDLGGGKTVFVKGLAKGAGSDDIVSSPTFTISRVYKSPKFEIAHYDFYRLSDPGIVSQELYESIEDEKVVTVIEWADEVKDVLPKNHVEVFIKPINLNKRQIIIRVPGNLEYLLKGLK